MSCKSIVNGRWIELNTNQNFHNVDFDLECMHLTLFCHGIAPFNFGQRKISNHNKWTFELAEFIFNIIDVQFYTTPLWWDKMMIVRECRDFDVRMYLFGGTAPTSWGHSLSSMEYNDQAHESQLKNSIVRAEFCYGFHLNWKSKGWILTSVCHYHRIQ